MFGQDRRVPLLWLERYGNLVSGVAFYFLTEDGHLDVLARQGDSDREGQDEGA